MLAEEKARKSAWELTQMREAARITDLAMAEIRDALEIEGPASERDIARLADEAMIAAGADGPAYLSMVQSGPRSAFSLALPTDRVLRRGELVMTDIGARFELCRRRRTRVCVRTGRFSGRRAPAYWLDREPSWPRWSCPTPMGRPPWPGRVA
jgi:Xaa-Pro aminopeptidase